MADYSYLPLGWTCQQLLNNATQNLGYDTPAPVDFQNTWSHTMRTDNINHANAPHDHSPRVAPSENPGAATMTAHRPVEDLGKVKKDDLTDVEAADKAAGRTGTPGDDSPVMQVTEASVPANSKLA